MEGEWTNVKRYHLCSIIATRVFSVDVVSHPFNPRLNTLIPIVHHLKQAIVVWESIFLTQRVEEAAVFFSRSSYVSGILGGRCKRIARVEDTLSPPSSSATVSYFRFSSTACWVRFRPVSLAFEDPFASVRLKPFPSPLLLRTDLPRRGHPPVSLRRPSPIVAGRPWARGRGGDPTEGRGRGREGADSAGGARSLCHSHTCGRQRTPGAGVRSLSESSDRFRTVVKRRVECVDRD
eukprot:scaffold662_cov364-Pavlova_lutheri.AAC.6